MKTTAEDRARIRERADDIDDPLCSTEVDDVLDDLEELVETIRRIEYVDGFCPSCKLARPGPPDPSWGTKLRGHEPGCAVARALS